MSNSKVYSLAKVPFSWENSPGVCKVNIKESSENEGQEALKLPPPPCPTESQKGLDQKILQIPLPPCPFQPPLKDASRKGFEREDPFLAAYMKCTKNVAKAKFLKGDEGKDGGQRAGRGLSKFSCKHSCGVREDGLVRTVLPPTTPRQVSRTRSSGRRIHS